MSSDFSEEAKRAIADGALRKARDRLVRDGCHSNDAIRRRIRSFAIERAIPPEETDKLLKGRFMFARAVDFCKKHNASIDWMMDGDLKGLQRMAKKAKAAPPVLTPDEFRRGYESLGEKDRAFISQYLRALAKKGDGPIPPPPAA